MVNTKTRTLKMQAGDFFLSLLLLLHGSKPIGVACMIHDFLPFRSVLRRLTECVYVFVAPVPDIIQPHPHWSSSFRCSIRKHNFTFPVRSSTLKDCNFINRMLFKDLNYSSYSQLWLSVIETINVNISTFFSSVCFVCMPVKLSAFWLINYY